jgi:hypothetical protein
MIYLFRLSRWALRNGVLCFITWDNFMWWNIKYPVKQVKTTQLMELVRIKPYNYAYSSFYAISCNSWWLWMSNSDRQQSQTSWLGISQIIFFSWKYFFCSSSLSSYDLTSSYKPIS